jgi:STE24 endopeptidase
MSRRTATRCPLPSPTASAFPRTGKQADYTVARMHLGIAETLTETALLLAFTLGGGVAALVAFTDVLPFGGLIRDLVLIVAVAVISGLVSLPFSYRQTFGIEVRFGFNRTTRKLWFADLAKGVAVGAALGLPLAALVMWLMRAAGPLWWLWAWAAWIAFQFLLLALYPTVIAPLFNKFSPLPEGAARDAIESLLARCDFANRGLFVMDGSRRSSHGNAFFTGFGRAKRIVFFDTLLERLAPDEVEAVLAHELGHFKLKHVLEAACCGWPRRRSPFSRSSHGLRVAVVLRRTGRVRPPWIARVSR